MDKDTSGIILLGIVDIMISLGGLYTWKFGILSIDNKPYDTILVMVAVLLALTTYFGFLAIGQSLGKGWASNKGIMRIAITSGVLVLYFFVVPIAIFLSFKGEMSEFMQSMTNNFTTTVGIIVSFYLGASAYVQAHANSDKQVEDGG